MALGLVGRKAGMTRVFTEDGASIPVTVVEVPVNSVVQIKSDETDGYSAVQVAVDQQKASRINKPSAGHYAKAGVEPGKLLKEFQLSAETEVAVGQRFDVAMFSAGQKVDVRGTSKGKGFAGGVKRHNFRTQDATHGNSISHRAPGSIGQCQTPGRVFKGKKMAGQLGNVQRCQQNLEIVRVDSERQLVLLKGAVPGATGGYVVITPGIKQ